MDPHKNNPYTFRNVLKFVAYAFISGVLALPAISFAYVIIAVTLQVFFSLEISMDSAVKASLLYSCLLIPIIAITIYAFLLKREKPILRGLVLSWAVVVVIGVLVVTTASAIGGTVSLIPTSTPTPTITNTPTITYTSTTTLTPTSSMTPTITFTPTSSNTPTRTPTLTPSLTPTKTLVPAINIYDVYENFQIMTEFQFINYSQSIQGKPVRQSVTVGNVQDNGIVTLSGPWAPWLINFTDFCVIITGVPSDVALELDGGETVYLEGSINRIYGNYSYYWNCENTLVLIYKDIR